MNPIHVRYQAALRPEIDNALIIRYCNACCQIENCYVNLSHGNTNSLKRFNANIGEIISEAFKITLRAKLSYFLEQQITILARQEHRT